MIDDDRLRTALRERLDRMPRGEGRPEVVVRRARRLRARRAGIGLVTLLVLSAGLAVPLWTLSQVGRTHSGSNVAGGSDGIHVTLPPGWSERMTYDSTLLGPS